MCCIHFCYNKQKDDEIEELFIQYMHHTNYTHLNQLYNNVIDLGALLNQIPLSNVNMGRKVANGFILMLRHMLQSYTTYTYQLIHLEPLILNYLIGMDYIDSIFHNVDEHGLTLRNDLIEIKKEIGAIAILHLKKSY